MSSSFAVFMLSALPAAALESQALGIVEPLDARVRQVFGCGTWSEAGNIGHYRIVLAEVSFGAGTEVYVQRIQELSEHAGLRLTLLETSPLRALNNDHAQYQVISAKCLGGGARSAVELVATFEHDEGDIRHRIRVSLASPGSYPISSSSFRPRRRR